MSKYRITKFLFLVAIMQLLLTESCVVATIDHASCEGTATGAIDVTVFIPPAYDDFIEVDHYAWNNGETTQDITNLLPDDYTLNVFYRINGITNSRSTHQYTVLHEINWIDEVNSTFTAASEELEKTGGSGAAFDAGAVSANVLLANTDGYVEFEITESSPTSAISFGLSEGLPGDNTSVSINEVDYRLSLINDGIGRYLRIWTNNDPGSPGTPLMYPFLFPYSPTATFKIERKITNQGLNKANIIIYINNVVALTYVDHPVANKNFVADASLKTSGAIINKARATFNCLPPPLPTAVASFGILKRKLDGGYYIPVTSGDNIYFKYDEEYFTASSAILDFHIYDDDYDDVTSDGELNQISESDAYVYYGDNRYELIPPTSPGYYILEVINAKNEKWYLRFSIPTP